MKVWLQTRLLKSKQVCHDHYLSNDNASLTVQEQSSKRDIYG